MISRIKLFYKNLRLGNYYFYAVLNYTRIAKIVGKYGGGVFCRLYDGVTDVLCSYETMQYDGDFKIGDSAEIVINKYNTEKKLVYGKILRKMIRR